MKRILTLLIVLTLILTTVGSISGLAVTVSAANDVSAAGESAITGFKGTSGDKKVSLSWNALNGAKEYTVYWKRSSSEKWSKAGTVEKGNFIFTSHAFAAVL